MISLFIGILFILAALTALSPTHVLGAGDEPTPVPTSWIAPDILEPYLPENPLLADKGAAKYWAVCMACHGDRGQGLTDEWRERGFGEDMNCWQSKCHGASHPPEGFALVRVVPPAIGPTTLRRFTTAAELHDYLLAKMPWWKPGSLTSEEAWQLTAFLLREDGLYPRNQEFNIKEAGSIPVHLPYHPQTEQRAGQWVLFGSLGLAALLLLAGYTRHALQGKPDPKPASNQAPAEPAPVTLEAQATLIPMTAEPNPRAVEGKPASTRQISCTTCTRPPYRCRRRAGAIRSARAGWRSF